MKEQELQGTTIHYNTCQIFNFQMQLKLDFHRNLQLWPIAATAWHVNCKCTNQLISVHWTFSLKIYNPCPSHLKSSFQYLELQDHLVTFKRQFYLKFRPFFDLSQYFQSTMNRCLNQATQGHPPLFPPLLSELNTLVTGQTWLVTQAIHSQTYSHMEK